MTLPAMSKKRAAAIADGSWKPKARKPLRKVAAGSPEASKVLKRAFGKRKGSERSKAKKRAWTQFSLFIRLRDADEFGRVRCVTCPAVKPWQQMDAGHWITRAKESALFDERNVHGQCKGCNRFQGGKAYEHEIAVDRIHGAGTSLAVKIKAGQACKRTEGDYRFIESAYAERVALQRINSPGKFK